MESQMDSKYKESETPKYTLRIETQGVSNFNIQ